MKKLGIVVTDPTDWTADALIQEARKRDFETFCPDLGKMETSIQKNIEHMTSEINLLELDAIIIRDIGPVKNDSHVYRFNVLQQLEESGVTIINSPAAIQNAANKFNASCLISKAGIPTPETFVTQETEKAMKITETLEDVVIKPVFGYKGIGIKRIKKNEVIGPDGIPEKTTAYDFVCGHIEEKGMVYIQEFIENPGRDIRAFVVDGKVIGAIYRNAPEGWWLNNLSQGGTPQECRLTEEQENMCIGAAGAIGAVFAGVDIIESKEGCFVLEVNATPSGAGIYKSLNINVAEYIIDSIENRL
ncbi:tetrahydromethanopterin:alpha-L-glutamate ligase [Methanolobus psychrotolerans]|uniref:tetrahydromethanopterin:alpha-L-glutamate ligase n=1 Tax=Methanolobus psychrotolerans TaxID=1874706 RepID=UPI000B9161A5|nr:tetrahydromethanopterin:alpha-L-glutamate ligase [Methanolobus psychrotolerans]